MIPLPELTPFPGNARRGNPEVIAESISVNGQYRPLIVRQHGGTLTVLAGNHTLKGLEILDALEARCEVIDCDDSTALRINLVDNKSSDDGTYDEEARVALLSLLDGDYLGTGYLGHELDDEVTTLAAESWEREQKAELETVPRPAKDETETPLKVHHRDIPFDAIFSISDVACSVTRAAYEMGFHPGIISTASRALTKLRDLLPDIPVTFIDNDWHNYDHAQHVAVVAEHRPKYATVRDVMTKRQCEAAGVEYYPFEQIMEMAQEVGEHTDNVIVVPKYDCLEKIPEEYVVGFSVPTSYGGTPMPAEAVRGRRVHLLGGSWAKQRQYLELLGDDVVSFDNNHLFRVALYGHFTYPNGSPGYWPDLDPRLPRTWQATAICSLAAIRDELNRRYAAGIVPRVEAPDPGAYAHDEDTEGEGE